MPPTICSRHFQILSIFFKNKSSLIFCVSCLQDDSHEISSLISLKIMLRYHKISLPLYSKTCLKRPLKKNTKIGFQFQLLLNAGQKYCRMLPLEHSAILSTFIKLSFSIKTFVLSIFKWPLKTGFTVFVDMIGIMGKLVLKNLQKNALKY